ncbi:unnamed protein product [Alopecurus aequalis]
MSSFTGVSIVVDGKLSTTSAVNAGTDSGYHLLLVQGYARTNEEVPTGKTISSGTFMLGGHPWSIEYNPNGESPECADFISIYLRLDEDVQLPVEVQFNFSFVDQVEKQKRMQVLETATCRFSGMNPCWGHDKFVRRDALERSADLKGDCFTIRCDIMVCKDPKTHAAAGAIMSDIVHHFSNLLQNKVGADVTFEVGSEIFAAHQCVLAARSKVFMAQLFGPMKEGTTSSVIQINGMKAKVFKALLSFIYTGTCFLNDEDNVQDVEEGKEEEEIELIMWLQDLLVAADIYDLQRLKLVCEHRLSEHIGVSSVASTLCLAEQHYCHGLKEACFKFIQVQSPPRLEKVMATHSWEYIRTTYPSLMNGIIFKLGVQDLK